MARSKLNLLNQEIKHYLGIPYWSNQLNGNRIIKNGPFGGKGSWKQISFITKKLLIKEKTGINQLSPQKTYYFQKKHHIGIDCSGLTFHLLNFWYKLNTGKSIRDSIVGTQSKKGVRRVNVKCLSNSINSIRVTDFNSIKTGDFFVMNKLNHVVFIYQAKNNCIYYVHSSHKTQVRGVHLGKINIINPNKDITYQQFSDKTIDGNNYNQYIFPKLGDGFYRLKIFKEL